LRRYGAAELQAAILAALERDMPYPHAVRLILERRREDRQRAPFRRKNRVVSAAKNQDDGTLQTPRTTNGRNGEGPAF